MSWQEVGDRVFRWRYERLDQNIGVILGSESVCVVDSRSTHADADELRLHVAALTSLPVNTLVNTHMHWDHTFGNARFPEATIFGHVRCRRRLLEDGEEMRSRLLGAEWVSEEMREQLREVEIVAPSVTFDDQLTIHVDDRTLDLRHLGRGHTDNDLIVTVDDVCFAGDLVEEGAPPAFGDSFPAEWVETVDRMLETAPPTIVPGHGDVVDLAFVRDQRDMLAAAIERIRTGAGDAPWPEEVMSAIAARMWST
jgi:glyoxylase-like metal-dependent hydrolase (beta-lactamase superfamily II)